MQEGGVRVEEVTLANETPDEQAARIRDALKAQEELITWANAEHDRGERSTLIDAILSDDSNAAILALARRQGGVPAEIAERMMKPAPDETRFSQFQLPGAKEGSYREIALVLPRRSDVMSVPEINARIKAIDSAAEMMSDAEYRAQEADMLEERARLMKMRKGSSEYTVPQGHSMGDKADINRLAHIRFNERTGPNGERVLFIEEIQSDWAQQGKKAGFKITAAERAESEALIAKADAAGGIKNLSEAEQARGRELGARLVNEGPPSGPFVGKTDAWVALSLKRMIRYAAENGFDQVAWTTGEQQAARYDLSKQVDYIDYRRNGDKYELGVVGKNGEGVNLPKDSFTAAELEDVVGKEIAKKIVNGEGQPGGGRMTLRGLDLKVGGEGMKGFYDKIVPTVAKDVLKKMGGGKVEQIDVVNGLKKVVWKNGMNRMESELMPQQGFTITPEMRAKVMEGQALFQKPLGDQPAARGFLDIASDRKLTIGLLENSDPSTLIHEPAHAFLEILNDLAKTTPELESWMQIFFKDNNITRQQWDGWGINEKREYHERFARGFESYVMSGKAPTEELRSLFQRFRDWLIAIYKSATSLNVKVSPEMEGLYAKLLGSEQADPPTTTRAATSESPPPPPSEALPGTGGLVPKGAKGETAAPDPLAMEADRVATNMADTPMEVTMPDGSTKTMTAAEYLAEIRDSAAMAREDIALIQEAAQCLLGAL